MLKDLIRACIINFGGSWDDHLHLVDFAYNNSYQSTIDMTTFKALCGRPRNSPSCWQEVGEQLLHGPEMVREMSKKIDINRK